MVSAKASRFAAIFAVIHSFSRSTAFAAEDPQITQAPTATGLERRQVAGGPGTPILSTLEYPFTALPEQVYPFPVLRGPQFGFNICNSTTLGPNSNCQTLIFNGPVSTGFYDFNFPEASCLYYVTDTVLYRTIFASGDLRHLIPPLGMSRLGLWHTALSPIMVHDLYRQVQSLAFRYDILTLSFPTTRILTCCPRVVDENIGVHSSHWVHSKQCHPLGLR